MDFQASDAASGIKPYSVPLRVGATSVESELCFEDDMPPRSWFFNLHVLDQILREHDCTTCTSSCVVQHKTYRRRARHLIPANTSFTIPPPGTGQTIPGRRGGGEEWSKLSPPRVSQATVWPKFLTCLPANAFFWNQDPIWPRFEPTELPLVSPKGQF